MCKLKYIQKIKLIQKKKITEEYQKTGEVKWKIKTFMKAAYW